MLAFAESISALPARFERWFAARGWRPREHQLALLEHASRGESTLLVAPTGGGKTLAGFLPSLIELETRLARHKAKLHTLYISPLKALTVDVSRNLEIPVTEMGLDVRIETRTGETRRAFSRVFAPSCSMSCTPIITANAVTLWRSHSRGLRDSRLLIAG